MTNSQRRLAWILPLFLVCGTAIAEGKRVAGHSSGCLAVIYGLRCGLVPTSGTRVTHPAPEGVELHGREGAAPGDAQ